MLTAEGCWLISWRLFLLLLVAPLVFRVPCGVLVAGLLDVPVGGAPPARRPRRELLLVAPTDLRPPRGLPARSPSAPRASLGASARSPARPRRPRGGLQSVGGVCVLPGQALLPPTGAAAWPPAPFTPVGPGVLTGGLAPVVRCSVNSLEFQRLCVEACGAAWGNCMRMCADRVPSLPTGAASWGCRRGGPVV